MSNNHREPETETIAETENYAVWKAEEPDGETTYHVELNNTSLCYTFFVQFFVLLANIIRMLPLGVTTFTRTASDS